MRMHPVVLLATIALTGCDNTQAAVGEIASTTVQVAGIWSYTDTITTMDETAACKSTVNSVKLTQVNNNFSSGWVPGTQKCTNVEESDGNTWGPVTAGELYGDFLLFHFLGCVHQGTMTGDPPNHMAGILSCSFPVILGGNSVDWIGTWEATRQ
jgi:hypothetical protein